MFFVIAFCLIGVSLAADPKVNIPSNSNYDPKVNVPSNPNYDSTYDGIFSTQKPYVHPDEYVQPENKEDQFDWKLSRTIFKDNRQSNVIISPLSVKILLTLLAEAAGQSVDSKTRRELEQVLPYNKDLYAAKEYFSKVLTSLTTQTQDYTVNFGTKVYVDEIVTLNQRFSSIVQHNYLADVENLNFNDARASAQKINNWITETTKGHIKDLVSEDSISNSVILLINALYFEGTWRFTFGKTLTKPFLLSNGQKIDKPFMEQTGSFYYFFSKHLNAKIVRLPYNGRRFSMFIILPNEANGLERVIERLDANAIKNEVWHMDELEVHIQMPKFKFDSSINLNDAVKKLGITDIFENNATFPLLARGGASEGKLKVSNIIQKSGIIVDEQGTTAWSATEIELVNKFGGEPREFIVDQPFLFYIEDDTTGAKLFSGRVNNPEY